MAQEKNSAEVFRKIYDNYNYVNNMMVEEMDIASKHGGLTGNHREEMWIKLFRSIIPKKFSIAQGVMIIDSYGKVSKEVDIAVFDEQYTPYVFQYNTLKFIPIEAVAIVIECKSKDFSDKELIEWADCIGKLKTRRSGIARIVSGYATGITNKSQINTQPIKILASLKSNARESTLEKNKEKLGDYFDFIIQKTQGDMEEFQVSIKYEDKALGWWANRLNMWEEGIIDKNSDEPLHTNLPITKELRSDAGLKFKEDSDRDLTNTLKDLEVTGNPLLSLNLQLNQLLMLINNPMLFPHFEYAKRFNKIVADMENEKAANNKQEKS